MVGGHGSFNRAGDLLEWRLDKDVKEKEDAGCY